MALRRQGPLIALAGLGLGVAALLWHRRRHTNRRILQAQQQRQQRSSSPASKSRHPDALGPFDEPLELEAYAVALPTDTAATLARALGDTKFQLYTQALTHAPASTYLRVQYLPAEDDESGGGAEEVKEGQGGDKDAAFAAAAAHRRALEARVAAAAAAVEVALRAEWGPLLANSGNRLLPEPLVSRHPKLPDVLVVPSSPPAVAASFLDPSEGALKVVVVDRLCGEAVLKGADVFARGVLVASADLDAGDKVALWCDLGDNRSNSSHKAAKGKKTKAKTTQEQGAGAEGADLAAYIKASQLRSAEKKANQRSQRQQLKRQAAIARQAPGGGGGSGGDGNGVGDVGGGRVVLHGSSLQLYQGRRVRLGWGEATMSRAEIMRANGGLAIRVTRRAGGRPDAPPLNGLLSPRLYAQHLPSAVCAHALGPFNQAASAGSGGMCGERVLDMCAAPGGKTTHLASLMRNKGRLFALDHSAKKVAQLSGLLASLGFTCATALKMDAAQAVKNAVAHAADKARDQGAGAGDQADQADQGDQGAGPARAVRVPAPAEEGGSARVREKRSERKARVAAARAKGRGLKPAAAAPSPPPAAAAAAAFKGGEGASSLGATATPVGVERGHGGGFEAESFDAILLDPPCSALGLRPRLVVDLAQADLDEFVLAQRRLLWAAVMLLKPGGRLVFSTCTVNPAENEGQVRYALDAFPCLTLVDAGGDDGSLRVGDFGLPNDMDSDALNAAAAEGVTEESAAASRRVGDGGGRLRGRRSVFGARGGLSDRERRLVQRFHSVAKADTGGEGDDCVGFFVAKFVKTESVRVRGFRKQETK